MSRRSRRPAAAQRRRRFVLIAAAAVLVAVGFYVGFRAAQPPPPPDFAALRGEAPEEPAEPARKTPPTPPATPATPGEEPSESPEADEPLVMQRQPPPGRHGEPRVAIVIDDLGRSLEDVEILGRLDVPLTYAVLPFETRTAEVVAELRRRGVEVFCHLPMEAKGGANPGPGALRVAMSPEELRRATVAALEAVPGAVGANNHMGSAVVSDRRSIGAVLRELEARGLSFLDSRTSADTLGYSLARQLGLPAAERQVFLDTYKDTDFIYRQFQALLAAAKERGGAIAIAHPYDETLAVLAAEVPKARAAGFDFVTASQLMDG